MAEVGAVSSHLRKLATEYKAASLPLFDEKDFATNGKKQVMATIGQTSGNVLFALADMLDGLDMEHFQLDRISRVTKIARYNDALRRLAAAGQWDEYYRISLAGYEVFESTEGAESSAPAGTGA